MVTLDLTLPEGSGFNLIARFKKQNPAGKVIVLSDFTTPGAQARYLTLGADVAFNKSDADGLSQYLVALAHAR